MSTQSHLNLSTKESGPVECLGQTFTSDDVRRVHYLKLLADKLKDPEFRKIEGFPIGEDEDILALSDPPYYTACPNPWIGEFIKQYGRPYDPKEKYHREPFAADVGEGKYHPLYKLHPYPTKVPHRAIMRYILHYTQPGDIIFDGFCGTGMAGVAAQLCGDPVEVRELGYRLQDDGMLLNEEGKPFSKIGARRAILNDLSSVAAFISYNYNTPVDAESYRCEGGRILKEVEEEFGWMYATCHVKDGVKGRINYVAWSDAFVCNQCSQEIVFWDIAVDKTTGKIDNEFPCPACNATLTKRNLQRAFVTSFDDALEAPIKQAKQVPVFISYTCNKSRNEKSPDKNDLGVFDTIDSTRIEYKFPMLRMPEGDESRRNDPAGITHTHQFYTKRNLACLAAFRSKAGNNPSLLFVITKLAFRMTKLYGLTMMKGMWGAGGGPLSGTLYMPSLSKELNILKQMSDALDDRFAVPATVELPPAMISTGSCSQTPLPSNSVDYIFLDPPFGANLMYSELNFLAESWLRVLTNNKAEAISNCSQRKDLRVYGRLMVQCFAEAFRILKPGRWMTVEFSNTQASVWNSIQTSLQEVGFVVANVSALDKQKGSFKAINTPTAVKQDLVISAYKPNGGLEERFYKSADTIDGVWDFIRTHLRNLPITKPNGGKLDFIAERDPRILYDRMVAFYIGHSVPVPLSSAEFQAALAEKFPEREGMFFLSEQVAEWDKKRSQMEGVGQMSIFVEDEKSAIDWLRNFLKSRPSVTSDVTTEFMQQLGASWKKFETRPELGLLLEQNFLKYDSKGDVPSQIHSYLSTQFKDLRNLTKDDPRLQAKARDRWFVPDPAKAVDVEAIRNKRLLQEFWDLCTEAGIARPSGLSAQRTLPLPMPTTAKKTGRKKLKEVRTEAVRLGFKECFAAKDYTTILAIAHHLPADVIEEDEQLQMMHDMAEMRAQS